MRPNFIRTTDRGRPPALAALLLAGCLGLAACGGGSEPGSSDEPETQGITVYSGRIPPLIGPVIDDYEARVDRDLQVRFGDSGALAATLAEEGENTPADVYFSQDAGSLDAVDAEGLLIPLPRELLERVPRRFRAADGTWVGISARARVIAYNPGAAARSELPASPLELTDPEWRGRVGWAPTNASLQAYVTALRQSEGDDIVREWLEGMVANETQAYESNTPVRDAIAAGEIDLGLINHYYVAQAKAEDPDYPVEVHFPPDDLGSLVNTTGVGVLTASDEPDEALDFIRYLLSREAQRYFAESSQEYPLVAGVEPDPTLVPLDRIPAPPGVDLSDLSDLPGTVELMQEAGAL
ncbi:MAG: iron ABC transporter substrate-binding protein [Solirubrobacterales bacterium]